MTQPLLDDIEIRKLATSYSILNKEKLDKRLPRLKQMAKFYASKMSEAPPQQRELFAEFIASLNYAMTIIKMHNALTIKLADICGEDDDEDRTSSTSR